MVKSQLLEFHGQLSLPIIRQLKQLDSGWFIVSWCFSLENLGIVAINEAFHVPHAAVADLSTNCSKGLQLQKNLHLPIERG